MASQFWNTYHVLKNFNENISIYTKYNIYLVKNTFNLHKTQMFAFYRAE